MLNSIYQNLLRDLSVKLKVPIHFRSGGSQGSQNPKYKCLDVVYNSSYKVLRKNGGRVVIRDIRQCLFERSKITLSDNKRAILLVDESTCKKVNLFYLEFLNGNADIKVKYPIAHYENGDLYVYWLFLESVESKWEVKVLEWLVKESIKKMEAETDNLTTTTIDKRVTKVITTANRKWIENNAREVERWTRDVSSYISSIAGLNRQIRQHNEARRLMEDNKRQGKAILKQLKLIRQNKHVRDIRTRGDNIYVFTTPLTMKIPETGSFEIGSFEIIINMDANSIGVFNELIDTLSTTEGSPSCDHPHIQRGSPCWGSLANTIPELLGKNDLVGLVNVIIEFLLAYHDSGAFISIFRFIDSISTKKKKKVAERIRRVAPSESDTRMVGMW